MQDILINFTVPVSRVKIYSLDTDEAVTLRAFNVNGNKIAADYQPPTGDIAVESMEVTTDGSQGFITQVKVDLTQWTGGSSAGPEFYDLLEFDTTEPLPSDPSCQAHLVNLKHFKATSFPESILLEWATDSEEDSLGFDVWRADKPLNGQCEKNSQYSGVIKLTRRGYIPTQGNLDSGAEYFYEDKAVISGKSYCYLLVEFDSKGRSFEYWDFAINSLPSSAW